MRKRAACLFAASVAVAFGAGCGGGKHSAIKTTTSHGLTLTQGPHSCSVPEGAGTMGECIVKQKLGFRVPTAVSGPRVADVSYFQGTINWTQALRYLSGAIVRVADGNFNDPAFARNWRALRARHAWHAAYYFLRPGNCAAEADHGLALVAVAGGLDSGPLIADAEVALNYGCAASFVAEVHRRTGAAEVIYTAPGTWPGGPHGGALLWVASYGPTPGCVWTCSHVAWQYTDGNVGPSPHCTPGIGCDDLSLDTGITRLGRAESAGARRARLRTAIRQREGLRYVLRAYGCRRRIHAREHLGRRCRTWKRSGDQVNATIRRLTREGVRA